MFGSLQGKKTYVVAFLAVLGAIATYLTGETSLADTAQLILTAILSATVRNAVK